MLSRHGEEDRITSSIDRNSVIMMLDDPFANIDAEAGGIMELLKERSKNLTIIVATHSLYGIKKVCGKKAILRDNGKRLLRGELMI